MTDGKFKKLLKAAHEKRASESGLRPLQRGVLAAAARAAFAARTPPAPLGIAKMLAAPAALAAAAVCIAALSYMRGTSSAESAAHSEIARLQAELEKTKDVRAEFAQLVRRYGRQKIARMAHSSIDYETAILIAEENYVQNAGNFRADLSAAIKGEERGQRENVNKNERL